MKDVFRRLFALAALMVMAGGVAYACDSPSAPRFPPPVVDDDTIGEDNEGIRSLRGQP